MPPKTSAAPEQFPWQRLSIRMLLAAPVEEFLKFIWATVAVVLWASLKSGSYGLYGLIVPALAIAYGFARYFITTYRITPERVQVRKKLIGQSVQSVRLDRVRTIEVEASLIHRLLGLATVRIASGDGNSDDGLKLNALLARDAQQLRAGLLHRAETANTGLSAPLESPDAPDALPTGEKGPARGGTDETLLNGNLLWARYAPLTSTGLVTLVGGLAATNQFAGEFVRGRLESVAAQISWTLLLLGGSVIILTGAALLAVGIYVVNYFNFTLNRDRRGRSLKVTCGLFTTVSTSIDTQRFRGVEMRQSLMLRWARAAKLDAISTGLAGEKSDRALLVPTAPASVVGRTIGVLLDDPEVGSMPLTGHGKQALYRRLVQAAIFTALTFGIAIVVLWALSLSGWWLLVAAAISLVGLVGEVLEYRSLGHALTPRWLVVRSGAWLRTRATLEREAVIGWNLKQSFFQRRRGLATLVATTAGGAQAYAAIDVPFEEALAIMREVTPRLSSTVGIR